MLFLAYLQTRFGHAFADAGIFKKVLFETANLLVEKEVRLMDHADRDVGDDFGGPRFDEIAIDFESDVRRGTELSSVTRFF